MSQYGHDRRLRPADRRVQLDMDMGHSSTDMRHTISRDVRLHIHNPTVMDMDNMGTDSRNTFTDPRFLRMRFRARIPGYRRRCVRRLRRARAVACVTAIEIGIDTMHGVESGRGRNATGIHREDSAFDVFAVCFLALFCVLCALLISFLLHDLHDWLRQSSILHPTCCIYTLCISNPHMAPSHSQGSVCLVYCIPPHTGLFFPFLL